MSGQIAFYAPGQKLAAEAQLAADGVTVAEVREQPYVTAPNLHRRGGQGTVIHR